jgi:N-acetyl-anhydromuramyl-L-alanine amidase AmpD
MPKTPKQSDIENIKDSERRAHHARQSEVQMKMNVNESG